MKLSDFDYILPQDLIAHTPLSDRGDSRLLLLNRHTGALNNACTSHLVDILSSDDILVFNDTKVMKARLFGKKSTGSRVECLLCESLPDGTWSCLLKPSRRLSPGDIITISPSFSFKIIEKLPSSGFHTIELLIDRPLNDLLEDYGHIPLPPYLNTADASTDYEAAYQTIFAKHVGAIAAPTAGLHFTPALIEALRKKGVQIETITLHVGYGTFQPVSASSISDHAMHEESYSISEGTASRLTDALSTKNIIAVGTTVARTLESAYQDNVIQPGLNRTNLYIYPNHYSFNVIDGLLTNFHLPKSSLLLLVCAYSTYGHIMFAYAHAIQKKYRFFSFGDAMLIR